MSQKLAGVASAACVGFRANVPEVVAIVVTVTHDLGLGVVQGRVQLIKESLSTFFRELVPQTPCAAPESGQPVIICGSRGHPVFGGKGRVEEGFHQLIAIHKVHESWGS